MASILRITFLLLAILLATSLDSTPCRAQTSGEEAFLKLVGRDGTVIPLWPPDGARTSQSRQTDPEQYVANRNGQPVIKNVSVPSMVIVPPPADIQPTGTTFLFAPGGGYGSLGLKVAVDICSWGNAMGAHCVLLKYRVPKAPEDPGRRTQLSDAQRAVRLLRSRAAELGIEADKIIMVGASAGGHLSFNLANNHGEVTYPVVDAADELSARPDAVVLLYPAYLTNPIRSLDADPWLHVIKLSPDRTPPVFMTVTRPDKFTWGAVNTMLHLRKARVPAELHVYPDGGHGGCFDKYPLMEFVRPASRFLQDQGMLTERMRKTSDKWLDDLESRFLKRKVEAIRPAQLATKDVALARPSSWTSGDRRLAALRETAPAVIALWPGDGARDDDPNADLDEILPQKPDGLVRISNVSRPTLHLWRPERPDGRAVVVFPGGAYNGLAAEHEGTEVAAWLNEQGITAFIAKYRVPRRAGLEKHAVALEDAQRAIRLVRSQADAFGVAPDQIGVLGFSAGGNLAALTVHQAHQRTYESLDESDEASARPDFAILIYPAYLTAEGDGPELDPLLAPLKSRSDYPPCYIAVAADDRFAPGSLHYLTHLHQVKVAGELHVFASGGHGKGLQQRGYPFSQWTQSCQRWLMDLKSGTTKVRSSRETSLLKTTTDRR